MVGAKGEWESFYVAAKMTAVENKAPFFGAVNETGVCFVVLRTQSPVD